MVIYDECHNSGAATSYAKTSSLFVTSNVLGLSATPYRQGLNDYLLRTSIGETIFKLEHSNLTPDIEIHNVWTEFTEAEHKRLVRSVGDYIIFLGVFNSMIKNKDIYFQYLADIVNYNLSQGHNIVVLFPTIFMQEKLLEFIEQRHPAIADKCLLLKGKTKQDALDLVKEKRREIMADYKDFKVLMDDKVATKELKRKEAQEIIKEHRRKIDEEIQYLKDNAIDLYKSKIKESQVIISNFNLLSAGFDKSQLSNIIFGGAPRIGKVSVIQSIGRITRKHEGKNHPLVQYFIPSKFLEFQKSTGVILNKNIRVQYPDAKFKYVGFQQ
jgi:superfamily II DNA or RNA helicase